MLDPYTILVFLFYLTMGFSVTIVVGFAILLINGSIRRYRESRREHLERYERIKRQIESEQPR